MMGMNAREELYAVADWFGHQHEDLSFGLKSAEDGLKLWRYWQEHQDTQGLPEFCDEAESEAEGEMLRGHIKKAVGYDPWQRARDLMAAMDAEDGLVP